MPVRVRKLQFVALRLAEKRADGFRRVRKTRIVFIHLHLGDDRDRFLFPARRQAVVERLLDQVADPALGIRHAVCQRGQRQSFPLVGDFGAAQIQPHLRAIAVGEHDVIVRSQHFEHRLSHRFDRLRLMLNRLAGVVFDNAVAADGDDHKLFHFVSFRRCVLVPSSRPSPTGRGGLTEVSSTCFTTNIPPIIR